ncbi:mechanosensitive ion channel family protein [Neisseria weixii]|uniref:Small-conductance mechanosensitive channel n=1 Tax=Neisseria weixii TaxID=1853276 RepID=A0A3N4MS04_9NEIS|nr:mechanosensitive ion channel family protein [Neisseria weixii]RPD86654.1 mechanosensitive ion channel family protein [Neisseria weixii]RPD87337.1 mechanosensitive ion channel family protein [Neisseria weixii]
MNFDKFTFEQLFSLKSWDRLAENGMDFGLNLLAAAAIFVIGRWLTTYIVKLMKAALTRAKVDLTLVSFLGNVANIGLLIMVIIAALGKLGVPTTSVTALVGGAGLAIALSLKDQLSNFAAGALIILFRPFKVGDYIKVNGFEGYVSEIKMVQTSLRTYANEEVILPNSVVMSNSITNKSSLPQWRAQVLVGVDYACDLKAAKAAVLRAATEHPKCIQTEKPATVQVTGLGDNAIEITLWAWTTEADWWGFQCDLYENVVGNLREVGINIPFPQRDIHIVPRPATNDVETA